MAEEKEVFISRQIKEDLENLERYVEEFSKFLPLPVYTINPTGIIVDTNKAANDLTGYNEEVIIGKEIEFLFENKKLVREYLNQALENKIIKNREVILISYNKKRISVNISISIRKDDKDNIIGCFLAISDITKIKGFQEGLERKVEERTNDLEKAKTALTNMLEDTQEAKEKIEEEQNKTRAVLTSITDGLIVFDKDKRIALVNPDAEKKLKIKESDVLNKKIEEILNFPAINKLYEAIGQKIEWTGQKYELILEKPIRRFFDIFITPIASKEDVIGMVIIIHDITRDKEISRMKTEFVSIAAHQLRTPLSAVKWSLHMILDGDVGVISSEQVDFLQKAYQSNERMILLINDLLNISRIEEGRFVYNKKECSLEEIIKESIDLSIGLSKERKIKLIFKKPEKQLPKIKIDKEKIQVVVQNLIDNGIRYNKIGGNVTISLKHDKLFIYVTIEDTGIGISDLQHNRIFDKFFRADNAVKADAEGTGLGLFISKNIIEAHEGKISFESKKNKGTIFTFSLPIN